MPTVTVTRGDPSSDQVDPPSCRPRPLGGPGAAAAAQRKGYPGGVLYKRGAGQDGPDEYVEIADILPYHPGR
jgi:hypothetical protein